MWIIYVLLVLLASLWLYARLTCGRCVCPRDRVSGKTVVITGGNAGIGRCVSTELVRGGANLIIGCRNTAKAESLKLECAEKGFKGKIQVLHLDLQSFASVRKFAQEVIGISPSIDVLINNAALGVPEEIVKSEDNFEVTFQTNYLSPVLLTHLLLPIIKRDGGRIVNVSSIQHLMGSEVRLAKNKTCPRRIMCFGSFVYGDTKLAMNYWTRTLAQRLAGTGITVNCCHPGFVLTDIFSHSYGNIAHFSLRLLANIYAKTPEEGAQTIVHLVLSRNASIISGKYWSDCAEVRFPRRPLKKSTAAILWRNTMEQCGIEEDDRQREEMSGSR
ncbi:retinol dehydrogenase 12 [Galendromus occidentalis]|uniref:Retinol dehydrogenase 12 n=1 Tax=Galendromus occidentalis TaxID=34638 RepID=A0AAJ6W069_9ACAR|nr:retinol dehydrogenase 12 [Galendromus occidentalis]